MMPVYLERKLLPVSPFEELDRERRRPARARWRSPTGRAARPDIKLGICGEHGGNPASIAVLPRGRPRLRELLAVPCADRPPRRGPRRARRRRPEQRRPDGRAPVANPLVRSFCDGRARLSSPVRHWRTCGAEAYVGGHGCSGDEEREAALDAVLAPGATRPSGAGERARERSARSVPPVLRARPRPHQALAAVAAARGQVPGVRRARRRPPPHPDDPRHRGRAGGHRHRARRRAVRAARRGDRARARLRARPGRSRERGGAVALPAGRLRPCGVRCRRHARAAQPVRADARRCAQPLVAPARAGHARGRGRRVGRSHRLRLPRLRGRDARRHPRAR